jgi:hypothetical protein
LDADPPAQGSNLHAETHRAASDCSATLHVLAQPLPRTGRLALQALLERARIPTWRLWARESAIETKGLLKNRVTPGALESSDDHGAGIATCQTPIRRRRSRGFEQT